MGRRRIKNLHRSKPEKKKKRHEERRPERCDFFSPVSQEKGEINNGNQKILGEIDRHVVAEYFLAKSSNSSQVKKKYKPLRQLLSITSTMRHRQTPEQQRQGLSYPGKHITGDFVGSDDKKDREPHDGERAPVEILETAWREFS